MQYHYLQNLKEKYWAQTIITMCKNNQISGNNKYPRFNHTWQPQLEGKTCPNLQKGEQEIILLSKLKGFSILPEGLITTWKVLIRPVTEYAAPLLHSGLSKAYTKKLKIIGLTYETIYKDYRRCHINYGTAMIHDDNVVELGLPKLVERRESLTIKFGVNTFNNERHNGFFEEEKIHVTSNTRSKYKIQEHTCITDSLYSSLLCQENLTRY